MLTASILRVSDLNFYLKMKFQLFKPDSENKNGK